MSELTPTERIELWREAEDVLLRLERVYLPDAFTDSEPNDWRCGLTLADLRMAAASMRRRLSGAMVAAGVAGSVPTPAALGSQDTSATPTVEEPKKKLERMWAGSGV